VTVSRLTFGSVASFAAEIARVVTADNPAISLVIVILPQP
jgi:hypothetical protein